MLAKFPHHTVNTMLDIAIIVNYYNVLAGSRDVIVLSMSEVAKSCGLELQKVRSELRKFADHEQASVHFSGQAYHVLSLGNFSPEQLEYMEKHLCKKMETQEKRQLERLYLVHAALCSESPTSPFDDTNSDGGSDAMTSDEEEEENPDLRTMIQQYFSEESLDRAYFKKIPIWPQAETTTAKQEACIRDDVQSLVRSMRDYKFTGKSVARIFHGIASPRFDHLWGYDFNNPNRVFWRKYLYISFDNLCSIANEELIKMNY